MVPSPSTQPLTGRLASLFSVDGKSALVTGGSRGIGLMIARAYVEAGARVYISSRNAAACAAVESELGQVGQCIAVPADLSKPDEVLRLAGLVAEREPSLDVLVNNAGATWGAPLDTFPAGGWDKVLGLNLTSVFFLTQALLPQLRAAGTAADPARIINIGSVDALHAQGGEVFEQETYPYSASKAALHQLTRVLAKRLGPEHITVNAIAPGPFESNMMASTLAAYGDEIAQSSPLGRIGSPDDMAGAALFLASRAGAFVTGAVLPLDGGIVTTL